MLLSIQFSDHQVESPSAGHSVAALPCELSESRDTLAATRPCGHRATVQWIEAMRLDSRWSYLSRWSVGTGPVISESLEETPKLHEWLTSFSSFDATTCW
jgi:hypothetical protein